MKCAMNITGRFMVTINGRQTREIRTNKMARRSKKEQRVINVRMGRRDAGKGQAYINPYRASTQDFTDYETGYFDTKAAVLKRRPRQ